jgi:hypothetical protein
MNKSDKNGRRGSLDPAKQPNSLISQRIYNLPPTQLDVRRQQSEDSQISITPSWHDQFPLQEVCLIRYSIQEYLLLLREEAIASILQLFTASSKRKDMDRICILQ